MAASISKQPGRMSFMMDTGEMNGSKAVYKTVSIGSVRPEAAADALASIAEAFEEILPWPVERVSIARGEYLIY